MRGIAGHVASIAADEVKPSVSDCCDARVSERGQDGRTGSVRGWCGLADVAAQELSVAHTNGMRRYFYNLCGEGAIHVIACPKSTKYAEKKIREEEGEPPGSGPGK